MRRLPAISLIVLLLALFAAGCSSTPGGVLGKEKMARVLADLTIADCIVESDYRDFSDDSTKLLFKQSIYARNGVTPEQVDTSLRWYGYHMNEYLEVYDRAIELVENDIEKTTASAGTEKTENAAKSIYATEGDSVDVWPDRQRLRLFAANMPVQFAQFNINSDRNWEPGDVYTLNARMNGTHNPVRLQLTAEYQDGTREYVTTDASGEGWMHVDLALDPAKTATQVYGYIHYIPAGKEIAIADSIGLVRRRASVATEGMRARVKEVSAGYGR